MHFIQDTQPREEPHTLYWFTSHVLTPLPQPGVQMGLYQELCLLSQSNAFFCSWKLALLMRTPPLLGGAQDLLAQARLSCQWLERSLGESALFKVVISGFLGRAMYSDLPALPAGKERECFPSAPRFAQL